MSTRFRKIVVPLDGTRSSERALSLAKRLAGTANGELSILRVDGSEAYARRSRGRQAGVRGGLLARAPAAWIELGANRRLQEDIARAIASAAARRDSRWAVCTRRP